jgi:hypothetical protein
MARITFGAGLKRAFIEKHRLWASGLPREQGKISSATAIVEAPQVGATATLEFDSQFLEVLKQKKGMPFELA